MSTITSLNTALETGLGSGCNILAMMLQQSVIDYIDENEGRTGLLTSELVSGGGCLNISSALLSYISS